MGELAMTDPLEIRIEDKDLPVLSAVATRAMTMISSDKASSSDLDQLIRKDPALAQRILRLANSPLYGGKVKISSISQSIVRLGMARLRTTIMIAATGDVYPQSDPHARRMWEHSLAVAYISFWLSEILGLGSPEDAFIAGMLHDVGKVVIYRQQPKSYGDLLSQAVENSTRFYPLEHSRLKFCSHESVGALVGRKWDLAPEIVEVIRFHHEIETNPDCVTENKKLVALVSSANLLSPRLGFGHDGPWSTEIFNSTPAKIIQLTEESVNLVCENLAPMLADQIAVTD
jgi:putative nucleotidyltransferase with HDIG domain